MRKQEPKFIVFKTMSNKITLVNQYSVDEILDISDEEESKSLLFINGETTHVKGSIFEVASKLGRIVSYCEKCKSENYISDDKYICTTCSKETIF